MAGVGHAARQMIRGQMPVERSLILPHPGDANETRFENVFGTGVGRTTGLGPALCDPPRLEAARRRQIFCCKPDGAHNHQHDVPPRSRGTPHSRRSARDAKTGLADS